MRFLLFLLLVVNIYELSVGWHTFMRGRSRDGNLGSPILLKQHELPQEQWFTQHLDHFNPVDGHRWNQRYFVSDKFYKQGGPIFLLIGGESAADPKWMAEGQWIEYAKRFNAMCFYVEHRYYGKSHPTGDLSVKNLLYLSSEQALGDLAYFIETMNNAFKFPNNTKWIVFGGSYAGSLAAWVRVKYPHLVHGAVSASSPLLAQIDFQQYYVVVENSLREYSQKCLDSLKTATQQFNIMLRHRIGQQNLFKKFNLCDPIDPGHTTRNDISNLYETLASNFAGIVQYNKDNRNNSVMANFTIESVCDVLTDETMGIPIDRLAYVSNKILNATQEKCLDYRYDTMIHKLRNVKWDSEVAKGERQWMYQTCTEFGFFQTSTACPNLFSDTFPVTFFVQQCLDVYGPRCNADSLQAAVNLTNMQYGGLNLKGTNIIFVHGSVDPWHVLGITKSTDPQVSAIYINGTAHCATMYPPSENDMQQLKQARLTIEGLIARWLN